MKAVVYGGPGDFRIEDVAGPALEAGGMIGRVLCCGICGTDYKLYHVFNPRFPVGSILGHEFVAEIVEVSDGVEGFAVGDRVTMATTVPCGECPGASARLTRGPSRNGSRSPRTRSAWAMWSRSPTACRARRRR